MRVTINNIIPIEWSCQKETHHPPILTKENRTNDKVPNISKQNEHPWTLKWELNSCNISTTTKKPSMKRMTHKSPRYTVIVLEASGLTGLFRHENQLLFFSTRRAFQNKANPNHTIYFPANIWSYIYIESKRSKCLLFTPHRNAIMKHIHETLFSNSGDDSLSHQSNCLEISRLLEGSVVGMWIG